ncbi:hypothetical protein [Bradyrhizobium sp. Arg816]|uniref:hypothetical protein n=1 Tax=Bradyrhizobium sp. Arg816 TaxID=2998491 RepID=UPI00249F4326|nr:hypothetical protein [Bradyrhizobium sp. Arg816]MDI3561302.1 hypothetical protein [Bradyrhizobium sp. Arg816]
MANGLAMTSASHRGSEGSHDTRGLPSPVSAMLNIGLLLAGCVAFVLAKSITTHGRVHIDDVEYLLVGVIPPALLYGLSLAADRLIPDAGKDSIARRLLTTWLLTLAAFCLGKELHVYEALRSVVEAAAGIGRDGAEFAMAFLLASLASMTTMTGFVSRAPEKRSAIAVSLASLVAISVMMHLLLLPR